MRVLLVEDDRMIGEAVERALREAAYATDWVRDGALAMTAMDTHIYTTSCCWTSAFRAATVMKCLRTCEASRTRPAC